MTTTDPALARPRSDVTVAATVVVPTFNEGGNIAELVRRLAASCPDGTEVLFVDDSTDDTPAVIRQVAANSSIPVRLVHRDVADRIGGLSGAVARGIRESQGEWVVVMDGDLQHPPELVPALLAEIGRPGTQLVVASRYCGSGDASGLSTGWRRAVSSSSTVLARTCFPKRVGRTCTDPMTGFFCVRRDAVDLSRLEPRGFKILLEILARHDLVVREIPFVFGERVSGESKASWRQGMAFLLQLAELRFGRMFRFALVGGSGVLLNLLVMAGLIATGLNYVVASILATEVAIVSNFILQERWVFADLRESNRHPLGKRALQFVAFNNADNLLRIPLLLLLVEVARFHEVFAQAALLAVAFVGRYLFMTLVVYRPRRVPGDVIAVPETIAAAPAGRHALEPVGGH